MHLLRIALACSLISTSCISAAEHKQLIMLASEQSLKRLQSTVEASTSPQDCNWLREEANKRCEAIDEVLQNPGFMQQLHKHGEIKQRKGVMFLSLSAAGAALSLLIPADGFSGLLALGALGWGALGVADIVSTTECYQRLVLKKRKKEYQKMMSQLEKKFKHLNVMNKSEK